MYARAVLYILLSLQTVLPAASGGRPGGALIQQAGVTVHITARHLSARARVVAGLVAWLRPHVEHDFDTHVGLLRVTLYPDHRSFATAARRRGDVPPQSPADNTGAVRHGNLLLGPVAPGYLTHNLVHVYSEWVMDRLTRNRSDSLPPNPWLYDGLAEYEAYRYAREHLTCSLHGGPPFDITRVGTATQWLGMRAGPLGGLEYCLAYGEVRSLVAQDGWDCIVRAIRTLGWRKAGHALLNLKSRARRGVPCV